MFESIKSNAKDLKRAEQILAVLAKHELLSIKKHKALDPEELMNALEELGGTFIKLGQLLSIRPDLIPTKYCNKLTQLTDKIKPLPTKELQKIVDKELKIKLSTKSIGSASIAQVHSTTYKGKKAVVKIIKPGVKEKFEADLSIIKKIAKIIDEKIKPQHYSAKLIYQEFEDYTRKELNLIHEKQNLDKVLEFKHKNVVIPKPLYASENILIMTHVPGTKLLKTKNKPMSVINTLAEEFWDQIFEYGVFHADPHPGNILVGKKVGLIDWGIVGELNPDMKETLKQVFYGVVLMSPDMVSNAVLKLNLNNKDIDKLEFKHDLRKYMKQFYGKSLEKLKLGEILNSVFDIVRKYDFHWGKNYVLLLKCVITIESTGLSYRKDFNLFSLARKYVKKKQKTDIMEIAVKEFHEFFNAVHFMRKIPEETSAIFDEEIRQERILENMQKEMTGLSKEIKKSHQEILSLLGVLIIAGLTTLLLISGKASNTIIIIGYLLSASLLLHFFLIFRR